MDPRLDHFASLCKGTKRKPPITEMIGNPCVTGSAFLQVDPDVTKRTDMQRPAAPASRCCLFSARAYKPRKTKRTTFAGRNRGPQNNSVPVGFPVGFLTRASKNCSSCWKHLKTAWWVPDSETFPHDHHCFLGLVVWFASIS